MNNKDFPHSLKGNNDLLSITQPQAIRMFMRYLKGSRYCGNQYLFKYHDRMADYHLEDIVY
jgi:5-methyltetrahydrofolate--homocysteine methyltransferase